MPNFALATVIKGFSMKTIFRLGEVRITAAASGVLSFEGILSALEKHASGDWGDLCYDDWNRNSCAVNRENRIVSAYHDLGGRRFWVITEADRRKTTVLLPEDYLPVSHAKQTQM